MVTIKDGCGCDPCDCDWKQKLKEAYSRAIQSVNKIGDNDGSVYFPDGTGFVKLPLPRQSDVAQIHTNTEDIAELKVTDVQLQTNITDEKNARIASITAEENARIASITAEENARKAKDEELDSDIARIDSTDVRQTELIQDNAGKIQYTYNELVTTEKTVATHNSEIITLQANNQALAKSLVSNVIMTDGTTAGSVQVSIEKEDGSLITSANYRWGKDIGIRLEAGTQEGYVKAVINLSDGTELVSNEYKIVEVLESDVYVTAITLIADQAAGTLGGNISYSNGTTQTINSVSVPTAPGVTSAIEALQGRMTAVEQKNATQDASITAIDGRVQALENTPGIGQFANGRLGTIAGSTADGRVKAENDGTGSVNGWSDLKSRVSTAEGQIVAAQNNISALDGTVSQQTTDISGLKADVTNIQNKNTAQDTAIAGKIAIAQGAANAGKALVVGSNGNVAPGEIQSGEVWEEVDFNNWPTDWVDYQRFKFSSKIVVSTSTPFYTAEANRIGPIFECIIPPAGHPFTELKISNGSGATANYQVALIVNSTDQFNRGKSFIKIFGSSNSTSGAGLDIKPSNVATYFYKMWRLKN